MLLIGLYTVIVHCTLVGYKYSQLYLNNFFSEAQIQLEAIQTLCDITLCWRLYTLNTLPLSEIV